MSGAQGVESGSPTVLEWRDLGGSATYADAVRLLRLLEVEEAELETQLCVTLGGLGNMDFLVPGLQLELASHGLCARVRCTSYNGWIPEALSDPEDDVWVIWLSGMGVTAGGTQHADLDVESIGAAVDRLRAIGRRVILIPPEPIPAEEDPFSPFVNSRRQADNELRARVGGQATMVQFDQLVWDLGMDDWFAGRYWDHGKAPAHPDAVTRAARLLGRVIAADQRPTVRAVAVDLDDTLWGGLVGEVGAHGLELDPAGGGRPYLELQRFLLDLSSRGVPIGIVSKNDQNVAESPFKERAEMLLQLDDAVFFSASWEPKHIALKRFAKQLNIGIDALCFLDDSAAERDQVRSMLPGVIVPELPPRPSDRVRHLLRSGIFLIPRVTEEDRLRVDYFRRKIREVDDSESLDDYLAGLQMKLVADRIDERSFERALTLLHKTNQFNFSMLRPSPSEFRTLIDNATFAYTYRLVDRLGDAGVIGALIATLHHDCLRVDSWVMSCRVFGRGVEWAIAEHLSNAWIEMGRPPIEIQFLATARNSVSAPVSRTLGFIDDSATGGPPTRLLGRLESIPAHHVAIVDQFGERA
jgi:FkbH-like protein